MSSMPSAPQAPAPAEPGIEPDTRHRPWPYVVVVMAVPFLVFGLAGTVGRLAAGLVLIVAAIAIAVRVGEAAGAAGARRAAARLTEMRTRGRS